MYSTEIDGETIEFGTSGFLYRSNKLMYDRKTNSLWHQFQGVPVVGPLVGSGLKLDILPMTLTTWADWLEAHPDTTVLDNDTGVYPAETYLPEGDSGSLYYDYRRSKTTMFPVASQSGLLATKDPVFGLAFEDGAKAYPQSVLDESPVVNDVVGGQDVVVFTPENRSGSRAYDRSGRTFRQAADSGTALVLEDETGARWLAEEHSLVNASDASRQLPRLPSRDAFWFGWHAFYPGTEVYQP